MYQGVTEAPPPTWAASAGPEDHNSKVKVYVGARDGTFFRIKIAQRGKDGLKLQLQPPQLCETRVAA